MRLVERHRTLQRLVLLRMVEQPDIGDMMIVWVEQDEVVLPGYGNIAERRVREVTMWIKDGKAVACRGDGRDEMLQEIGFTNAGLAHNQKMAKLRRIKIKPERMARRKGRA